MDSRQNGEAGSQLTWESGVRLQMVYVPETEDRETLEFGPWDGTCAPGSKPQFLWPNAKLDPAIESTRTYEDKQRPAEQEHCVVQPAKKRYRDNSEAEQAENDEEE